MSDTYQNIDEVSPLEEKKIGIQQSDKDKLNLLPPGEKNVFILQKIDEIDREIEKLNQKKTQLEDSKKDNDNDLNDLDDELPELRDKIEKKEAALKQKGIDMNDHKNPLVKDYDLLVSQYENKKEIKSQLIADNDSIKPEQNKIDATIDELNKQKQLLDTIRFKINVERIDEAKDKAVQNLNSEQQKQSNPVLDLFEVFLHSAHYQSQVSKASTNAETSIKNQIQTEENKFKLDNIDGKTTTDEKTNEGKMEGEKESAEENKSAIIFLAHDKDGKDIIRIMSVEEAVKQRDMDETKDLGKQIEAEANLPEEQRKTSSMMLMHPNRQELIDSISQATGKPVKYANELHNYISTDDKRDKVLSAIIKNCSVNEKLGGNFFDKYINNDTYAQSQKKSQANDVAATYKPQSKLDLIPWDDLKERYGMTKQDLSEKDLDNLVNNKPTGLFKATDDKGNEKTFRLRIELNPISNRPQFIADERQEKPSLKELKGRTDYKFSKEDKANLIEHGQLNHLIPIKQKNGTTKDMLLILDRQVNKFFLLDPAKMKIGKAIKEQIDEEQVKHLKQGKAVHVDNLTDRKGQKFTGWIKLNPMENAVEKLKEKPAFHIDKRFEIQVRNNNYGQRADAVKDDKDAALKSGQNKNDDAPSESISKQKSVTEDNDSYTESTKTKRKIR